MAARDDRAHIRLPSDLKRFATEYAQEHNMSFSDVVIFLLTKLREAESRKA